MKKILLLFICLLSFNVVNALSLDMVCPDEINYGEEINVSVYLNKTSNEDSISAIEGILSYEKNKLLLEGYDNLLIDWRRFSANDKFAFGNLKFNNMITTNRQKVFDVNFIMVNNINNISLAVSNIVVTDSNGDEININTPVNCSIKVLSNINTLSSISLSSGEFSQAFNPDKNIYYASVDTGSISIDYNKSDDNSLVNCNCDNIKLNYGNNVVKITVTSESGVSNTYTININRIDNRTVEASNDNNLSSLKITNGKINFSKKATLYNVTVASNIDNVTITSTLSSNKASYIEWAEEKKVNLEYGLNEFNIKIKAENGDIKTYTINITRTDDRDSNNYLSNITLSAGNISFESNILEYVINVDSDVDNITITPTLSSNKSKVEITGPNKLEYGSNDYQIKVTAENKETRIYKLKIVRNKENTKLSNVALLESLVIYGYNIKFDSNVFEYSISSNERSFKISATPMDNGTYYVLNDGNIDTNNELIIRVTAEDGSTKDYIIKVNELAKENENSNIIKFIPILIISILLVVAIICFIYMGKNKLNIIKKKD